MEAEVALHTRYPKRSTNMRPQSAERSPRHALGVRNVNGPTTDQRWKVGMRRKLREGILRQEGALTKTEAAAFVGAKTLAEFDRWQRSGAICDPIPGTQLWSRDELIRHINSLPPAK